MSKKQAHGNDEDMDKDDSSARRRDRGRERDEANIRHIIIKKGTTRE